MSSPALSLVGRALGGYYARAQGRDARLVLDELFTHFSRADTEFSQAAFEGWLKGQPAMVARGARAAALRRYYAHRYGRSEELIEERVVLHFAAADAAFDARAFRVYLEGVLGEAAWEDVDVNALERALAPVLRGRTSVEAPPVPECRYRNLITNLRRERAETDEVVRAFAEKVGRYRSTSGSGGPPRALRGVHPRSHGVVSATFEVTGDGAAPEGGGPSHLPVAQRVGIFREAGRAFACKLRFSASGGLPFEVLSDAFARQSHGLGIKLLGEDGGTLQDFLFNNAPVFPSKEPGSAVPQRESEVGEETLAMVDAVLAGASDPGQPLFMEQFSISAYAFGTDRAVKYGVRPGSRVEDCLSAADLEAHARILSQGGPDFRREALTFLLARAQRPIELRFCVQFADPDDEASGGCPIDDETVAWRTPWRQVARILIPPQEPDAGGDRDEDLVFDSYHVWGPEHLPIGRLNRARLWAYARSAAVRHRDNRVASAPHPYRAPEAMKVAVVGAGAAGLSCALALSEFGYRVTVYERAAEPGGHATTRSVRGGRHLRDPAFGVFRRRQCPNLWALLKTLGVEPTSLGQGEDWFDSPFVGWFHEDGTPLQRSPEVMQEGRRFAAGLARALADPAADGRTVGELVEELGLSGEFLDTWFLGGVILYFGGHPIQHYLDYPLRLIAWMWQSNVAERTSEPLELFRVRDAEYIGAFAQHLRNRGVRIRTGAEVRVVRRGGCAVRLRSVDGEGERAEESFGELVLAVQPKDALQVLGSHALDEEREVLFGFEHTVDTVVVHADRSYLPADPADQKLANIRLPNRGATPAGPDRTLPYTLCLPCDRDGATPILATYDYGRAGAWQGEVDRFTFSHVRVTPRTQELRRTLSGLQGRRRVRYAGSWLRGLTLHEDAVVTGLDAANAILGPNSGFRVLAAPLELPEPFGALPESSPEGADFAGGARSIEAALKEVLRTVLEVDTAELHAGTDVQALGMSSLQVARLANAINAGLPASVDEPVDIIMLLQMETLGEVVEYVHATARGGVVVGGAVGRGSAPVEERGEGTPAPEEGAPLGPTRREFIDGLEDRRDAEPPIPTVVVVLLQCAAILALLGSVALSATLAFVVGAKLYTALGPPGLAAGIPAAWATYCLCYSAVAVGVKWAVVGRLAPGRYRIHGRTHLRWWTANLFLNLGQQSVWLPFRDSHLGVWLLRLLGSRVRAGCTLNIDGLNPAVSLVDADLLDIGERAYLRRGAAVQCHMFVDRSLVLAPVELGERCVVWTRAVVEPGARVGAAGAVEAHSVLGMGSRVPAGAAAGGVPAARTGARPGQGVGPPSGAAGMLVHTLMGFFVFPYLLALAGLVFHQALSLMVGEPSIHDLDWRTWFALWPAFIVTTLVVGAAVCAVKWLLLGRLRPGQRESDMEVRLAVVKFVSFLMSRLTLLCPRDLRWLLVRGMGGRVAYGSVTDCPLAELAYADLLTMEAGSFYSPAAFVDFATLEHGELILGEVRLERAAYVGAYSTLSAPVRLPELAALASASSLPAGAEVEPSEVWVGSPARCVALGTGEVARDAHAMEPGALLRNRLVDLANHYFIVLFLSAIALFGLHITAPALFPPAGEMDVPARLLASFALICFTSFAATFLLLPVLRLDTELLRWLCARDEKIRTEGFERSSWKFNVWHLLSNHLLPYGLLTDIYAGTPFQAWLARRLGARVGREVYLANGVGVREFTFTRLGDGVMLNRGAALIAHTELPNGRIVMKDIELGEGASMGVLSYGAGGTGLTEGVLLGSLSRPFDSQVLEAGGEYDNTPCRRRSRGTAAASA